MSNATPELTEALEHLTAQQTRLESAREALDYLEAMTDEERLDALDEAQCAYDDLVEAASIVARLERRLESPPAPRKVPARRAWTRRDDRAFERDLVAVLRMAIALAAMPKRAA